MTLPAFASTDDLGVRIPNGIADADEPRAQAALDDASALIRAEVGDDKWMTDGLVDEDLPTIIPTITMRAAYRAFTNPAEQTQSTTGPFSGSWSNATVYLTQNERALVARAAGNVGGLTTLTTTRGPIETLGVTSCWDVADEYLPVEPDGKDIPFL